MQISFVNYIKIAFHTLFLLAFICGCSYQKNDIPYTQNEVFDQLLQNAPAAIIDLDSIVADTVLLRPEHILGTKSASHLSEPIYIGFPVNNLIKLQDSLYVPNRQQIHVMNEKGVWQRSVGRQGQGPGEFNSTVKIAKNSNHIFALDFGNARIQVYDHNMHLLYITNMIFYDLYFRRNFALTDTHFYMGAVPHTHDNMVAVYKADDLGNRLDIFWPNIIPHGQQPAPYRDVILDANNRGEIAITNVGLPYLFLLNRDRKIDHVLYFESAEYKQWNNPSAHPVHSEGNTEQDLPGVRSFVQELILMDNQSIYFTVGNNLYQIVYHRDRYLLNKAWHFIHEDSLLDEKNSNGMDIGTMFIENEILYFIPLFGEYVFAVPLV